MSHRKGGFSECLTAPLFFSQAVRGHALSLRKGLSLWVIYQHIRILVAASCQSYLPIQSPPRLPLLVTTKSSLLYVDVLPCPFPGLKASDGMLLQRLLN